MIKLRDDWENMIRDTNYQIFSYGVDNRVEEVEGITMLSMLFCSHGGLITPILYPHNNIVEFVTNNALSDDITEGGNVSFDKLLGGTELEIEEVYAYKEGAYVTGNYRDGGCRKDR